MHRVWRKIMRKSLIFVGIVVTALVICGCLGNTIGTTKAQTIEPSKNPSKHCCFPAGTKITLADGSLKNIEDIVKGDKVLSINLKSHEFYSWPVFATSHPIHPVYELNAGLLQLTADHPLFIEKSNGKSGWGAITPIRAAVRYQGKGLTLELGDQLTTSDLKKITVEEITFCPTTVQTYNIASFIGNKNYFANGILVFEEAGSIPYLINMYLGSIWR